MDFLQVLTANPVETQSWAGESLFHPKVRGEKEGGMCFVFIAGLKKHGHTRKAL